MRSTRGTSARDVNVSGHSDESVRDDDERTTKDEREEASARGRLQLL